MISTRCILCKNFTNTGIASTRSIFTSRDRLYILQSDVGARPFDSTGTCAGYPSTNPTLITACDVNKISGSPCTASDALLILQCDVGGANALCPTNRDDYSIYIPDF